MHERTHTHVFKSTVISSYNQFHFLKSNFIEYKNTVLTSGAVTTLNKKKILCVFLKRPLYIERCLSYFL